MRHTRTTAAAHRGRPIATTGIRVVVVELRWAVRQTRFPTRTRSCRPSKRQSAQRELVSSRHDLERIISKRVPAHIRNRAIVVIANGVRSGVACGKFFLHPREKILFFKPGSRGRVFAVLDAGRRAYGRLLKE